MVVEQFANPWAQGDYIDANDRQEDPLLPLQDEVFWSIGIIAALSHSPHVGRYEKKLIDSE